MSFFSYIQVYFQNNPLSGFLILLGMFVQSTRVAVHGVIAIVVGNLAGLLMGFDKSFLSCGLFGYNSFLVGLAIGKYYINTIRHMYELLRINSNNLFQINETTYPSNFLQYREARRILLACYHRSNHICIL